MMTRPLLRGLGLVLLLIPGDLRADEAEERAVQMVQKLGGKIDREGKSVDQPIVTIDLSGRNLAEADLKQLAGLNRLYRLDLSRTGVTDRGLKALAPLQRLGVLDLSETKVTDAGLTRLLQIL
jgi:hypothetical protein